MSADERKAREREFFNERNRAATASALQRYYASHAAHRDYFEAVGRDCRGKAVLEYGSGSGLACFDIAAQGARVSAIDISDVAVENGRREAARRGLDVDFRVGDAERMPFADASFDLVCGSGILHHLRMPEALAEVARVLKPAGRALFIEPMGHNPFVRLFRHLTPGLRSADERALRMSDLALFDQRFAEVRMRYYDLLSLFAIPLLRLSPGRLLFRVLERADQALFALLPPARPHAGFVVVEAAAARRAT
jgi:SAM-dependent methyltransferase